MDLLIKNGVTMLILTRCFGEKIVIGSDIVVTVIKMEGKKVRLGIEAPKDVSIYREEIFKRLQEEGHFTPPIPTQETNQHLTMA